jgi:hypothetical protein
MTYVAEPYRCFSAGQHSELIRIFQVEDSAAHVKLLNLMEMVSNDYLVMMEYGKRREPIKSHRSRLQNIESTTRRLHDLLAQELASNHTMIVHLISPPFKTLRESVKFMMIVEDRIDDLADVLKIIEVNARELLDDNSKLRRLRQDPAAPERAKSLERRAIWEPTFRCWESFGRRVGYSHRGPLVKAIAIFHQALGLPLAKHSAIEAAIRGFKAKSVTGPKKIPRTSRDAC